MHKNILLCGVGGQGIVLASKLLADAAMAKGLPVMSAETIGMAQKGGSVFSHLRLGEGLHCPLLARGSADLIIGFEPAEAVRMLPYLKAGGSVVVNADAVIPVSSVLKKSAYDGTEMVAYLRDQVERLLVIDGAALCRAAGSPQVLNIGLLGAAIQSGELPFDEEDMAAAIRRRVKPQYHEMNLRALHYALQERKDGEA